MDKQTNKKRLREIIGILRKYNLLSGITPDNLKLLLEELGPTFVKAGQIMSMQPNILPAHYCKELEKLRTNVAPMSYATIKSILEAEYGTALNEVFSDIDLTPLGSASIAQVHIATLVDGTNIVLKIQRPGIYDTMYHDIQLIKKAAGIIKFVARIGNELDIHMIIDEIWAVAKQEMDFTTEAENACEFYENNSEVTFATCPKILKEYSTSKVLAMEYINGFFIDDFDSLVNEGYDLDEIAGKLAFNFVKQVIDDGFFHADPHSGNILIRDGKIVWIDLGMMGRLSSRDRKLYAEAVSAIAHNDITQLADFALKIGVYDDKVSYSALCGDIETALNKYGSIDFSSMDLVKVTDTFLAALKAHGISMPRGISMLPRAMLTIQGTLRILNPNINFIEIMVNYMTDSYWRELNLKNEIESILKSINYSFRKSLDIPAQISDTLKMFSKGITKANIELSMSEEMKFKLAYLVNKVVIALIISALLIASSFISTTDMYPQILGIPALGAVGYFTAFVLGVWMLISVVKKK